MGIKTILAIICFAQISLIACNKEVEDNGQGSWTLYSTQHEVNNIQRRSGQGYFVLSATNELLPRDTLEIYFASTPTITQQYKIVPFTYTPSQLNANEIGIIGKTFTDTSALFYSTGISQHFPQIPTPMINVVVNDEKIKVEIPKTFMVVLARGLDSTYFQGTIWEQ